MENIALILFTNQNWFLLLTESGMGLKVAGCHLTQDLLCSSWDMQPSEAPHCTQLQQEAEEVGGGGGGDEGRGQEEGEENGSLLMGGAGDREYLDEEGNPCLLFKLPQHINRPSQLCIIKPSLNGGGALTGIDLRRQTSRNPGSVSEAVTTWSGCLQPA